MSFTQFSMVEELASLVRDNIPCRHLIMSVEDALVNFLQDDTSFDGFLELEPMNPYYRLLVHRLADIFGFSHQSVGEGEDRHLVLERCPETSMPAILVSDFLLQSGETRSPMIYDVLRRKDVMPDQKVNAVGGGTSLEERETTYLAARARIFSEDARDTEKERPKSDPVVARRMITRALGQTNKLMKHEPSSSDTKENGQIPKDVKFLHMHERGINPNHELELKSLPAKHPRPGAITKGNKFSEPKVTDCSSKSSQQKDNLTLTEGGSAAEPNNKTQDRDLRKEHLGAAKRLFANALGTNRRDVNQSKLYETKNTGSGS